MATLNWENKMADDKTKHTIRTYLHGGPNPSPFTLRAFVGMIEGGEATVEDFREIGGDWLVAMVRRYAEQIGSKV